MQRIDRAVPPPPPHARTTLLKKHTPQQQATLDAFAPMVDDLRAQLNTVLEAEVAKIVASIEAFQKGTNQ